jgi:hypothetical protein
MSDDNRRQKQKEGNAKQQRTMRKTSNQAAR